MSHAILLYYTFTKTYLGACGGSLYNSGPSCNQAYAILGLEVCPLTNKKPASADRTARRQFQAVFPVITGSFPTNVIAHLHGLSMDLTVGRTVGPTVDSTVG